MTIYVDELVSYQQQAKSGGRYFGSGKQSCHMMTDGDDLEELHRFAERIGLKRAWFQNHPRHPHYDLTPSKRALAVRYGAQEVNALAWARRRLAQQQAGQRTAPEHLEDTLDYAERDIDRQTCPQEGL